MTHRPARPMLVALGLLMTGLSILLARVPHDGRAGPGLFLLIGVLTLLYVASVLLARRLSSGRGLSWAIVVILGLLVRIPLVTTAPLLSDDVYRYVWDGRVTNSGENPYRYPPSAPELRSLRDEGWSRINNPELNTIYPPFAQAVFSVAGQVMPGVYGMKLILVLFDLLLAFMLLSSAARAPGDRWKLVLYWWHPLPILEFAWSGHIDIVGIGCLTAALLMSLSSAPRSSVLKAAVTGVLTALAAMVKFVALPAAPFLAGRRWLAALFGFIAAAALLYAPFFQPGLNVTGSLVTYAARWRANDFFFGFLLRPGTPLDQELRLTEAKLFAVACLSAVAALIVIFRASRATAIMTVIGAAIVLSPTIHPWYVAWLLPFLAFRFSPAWFYLTLSVLLAYQPLPGYLAGNGWHELWAVKAVIFVPSTALALLELKRHLWPGATNAAATDSRSRGRPPRTGPETA